MIVEVCVMNNTVLITGSTGTVGGKLAARVLSDGSVSRVVLLVRGESVAQARARSLDILRRLSPETDLARTDEKMEVLCGDITLAGLGLSEDTLKNLTAGVTHIIHAAASTAFDLPLECARRVNCTGTRNVLTLAAQARQTGTLRAMAHISTAFVGGSQSGVIYEDSLPDNPYFSNTYEQTKWETEKTVRALASDLPVNIFRPSIVVGDSRTGRTTAFNVLYAPLKLICRGALRALPCSPDAALDVVPVDYVADAIHHILLKREQVPHTTYHIVAGADKCITVGEIVSRAVKCFDAGRACRRSISVEFAPDSTRQTASLTRERDMRRMHKLMKRYTPYLSGNRTFDNANTTRALRHTNIEVPNPSCYLNILLDYCLDTDWGERLSTAA
jgi:thioester reductase-like protein